MLQTNDVILFQGDSITDAFRKPEEVGTSYRLGAGYAMLVAAQLGAERPELALRFENRGVSGNRLDAMADRWDADALALSPTVLSLLVGVNDTLRARSVGKAVGADADDFAERYAALLERTRGALPGVRLVLCEPFLLKAGDITDDHLADLAPRQRAVAALAERFDAVFVPLQQRFEQASASASTGAAYWLFDGIHPNAAGQWLIAQAWLQAVCGDVATGAAQAG